ncbi:GTP cyclohydrolase I FolE [bacterium]|nr:GTP cyclohydrolase I FolE [bacterium]
MSETPRTSLETNTALAEHLRELLEAAGETPDREGLLRTPERFLKAFSFLTRGYKQSISEIINGALFEVNYQDMVIVKNIEFYSLCEHHLVPFFGKCHVGYLPQGRVIGLSKIPRIVDAFASRLQVQERLTHQVSECLMKELGALGVGVVMQGHHLCMMMRGVEKQGAETLTSSLLGDFQNPSTRAEFFNLIK